MFQKQASKLKKRLVERSNVRRGYCGGAAAVEQQQNTTTKYNNIDDYDDNK